MDNKQTATFTFPTLSILGIVFVTLKLLGKITWSWWWVTAPFWGPIVLILGIFLVTVIGFFIAAICGVEIK